MKEDVNIYTRCFVKLTKCMVLKECPAVRTLVSSSKIPYKGVAYAVIVPIDLRRLYQAFGRIGIVRGGRPVAMLWFDL